MARYIRATSGRFKRFLTLYSPVFLPLNLCRPLERQDVLARAFAMPRPCVHKFAPPRQRVRSPVGLFGLVADDMRQRVLGKFAREVRLVARPIAE